MAIKQKKLNNEAEQFVVDVAEGKREWLPFLDSAAYMYKYRFPNQIAIYLQRPESKACTTMKQWNNLGRSIKKGVAGIRLLEQDRFDTSIYVFSADDTVNKKNPNQMVNLWTIQNVKEIENHLREIYDLSDEMELDEMLDEAVDNSVNEEYFAMIDKWMEDNPELCTAEIVDDFDQLFNFVRKSAKYVARTRCGLSTENYAEEEFSLSGIKSKQLLSFEFFMEIGKALQHSVDNVVEVIEKDAKAQLVKQRTLEYNKQKEEERKLEDEHSIQDNGERIDSGLRGRGTETNAGQIREDERRISVQRERDALLSDEHQGDIESEPDGHRQGSRGNERELDSEVQEEGQSDRGNEDERSNQMGGSDEEYPQTSGSNSGSGTHRTLDQYIRIENIPRLEDYSYWKKILPSVLTALDKGVNDAYLFFDAHYDELDRTEYVKSTISNAFYEINIEEERAGFKAFEQGLLIWKGAYLSRTEEVLLPWERVSNIIDGIRLTAMQNGEILPSAESQMSFLEETPLTSTFNSSIIDYSFRRGSGFDKGKLRIYRYYKENPDATLKDKAAFLSKEYGIGGCLDVHEFVKMSEWHDFKGICLKPSFSDKGILIKWNEAAKRIGEMISEGTYLYAKEYEEYKKELEAEELKDSLKVTIEFSESPAFYEELQNGPVSYRFCFVNRLLDILDQHQYEMRVKHPGDYRYRGYYKTYCKLEVTADGKEYVVGERYDIGDNTLGVNSIGLLSLLEMNEDLEDAVPFLHEQAALPLTEEEENKLQSMLDRLDEMERQAAREQEELSEKVVIDGNRCNVIDTWESDNHTYTIGNSLEDSYFYYASVSEVAGNMLESSAVFEYNEQPSRDKVESDYTDLVAERAINEHESEFGADGSRNFPLKIDELEQQEEQVVETEALYILDGKVYLHLQQSEAGWDYTLYQADSYKEIDGGFLEQDCSIETARNEIINLHELSAENVTNESLNLIDEITEANRIATGVQSEPFEGIVQIGKVFTYEERIYRVDSIEGNKVELQDITFKESRGFPIFRAETLDTVFRMISEENEAQITAETDETKVTGIIAPTEPKMAEMGNYTITDYALGNGTKSEKFEANITAIRTLKQIEAEHRLATAEEQDILSAYVGWGGLADYFEDGKSQNKELQELLTPEEYKAAKDSVLNAHYTQPLVIEKMYDILDNLGFRGGTLLEPSMGVGNFFGMLPEKFKDNVRLHGVELDSISARISKKLYPQADIQHCGYEETTFTDNSFDAAIGNVPFGDYGINDKKYNRRGFMIHDYFFAKTIDQVRPGGVIAFITSKGTLDKKNSSVRKYIAERADLLGAIRLPNTAFKANAGTEVTSDILILQKREVPVIVDENTNWLSLGTDEKGLSYNQYFIDNPEMVIGEMQEVSGRFGNETACILENQDEFSSRLDDAVRQIQGSITEISYFDEIEDARGIIPADVNLPNYAYSVIDGHLYYRENSQMLPADLNVTAIERAKGMIEIRDCVRELIDRQLNQAEDAEIKVLQGRLNELYDEFTEQYGLINSRGNSLAFRDDSSYPLICSLENIDDDGNLIGKADIFTKRTVRKAEIVESVDTAAEALAASLEEKGKVDLAYMGELSSKTEEQLVDELKGIIFRVPNLENPESKEYVPADEYLSGNVRRKLTQAKLLAASDKEFEGNITALEEVMPEWITAAEIDVRLGSIWVPQEYYEQFMYEILETPYYYRNEIGVIYSELTGTWSITNSTKDKDNTLADTTYGTKRASAYRIIKDTLNMRSVSISDTVTDADGSKRQVPNPKETALACQKQDLLKEKFKTWVWEDVDRRNKLEEIYNTRFNSRVTREFNGDHLTFPGMNPEIRLREHQRKAIARQMYGGNTLLAHCVGAGKTFEMAAAIMEKRRLGLCSKAMLVVPNHLTGQWAKEFMTLYPTAKLLAVTKKDFQPANRKKFCSRIATGDYDAVIIGHSQFEMIPLSKPRQRAFIEEQLDDIQNEIMSIADEKGQSFTIKQLTSMEKKLKAKLEKLNEGSKKDNVITFEELGVDFLCVDEAHGYKNLALNTKMNNVAGISTTGANKSYDMFAKCRYIDELTHGRGITFATGTPVSNSMTELYTMQKYLQYDTLKELGLLTFDAWASTYGETMSTWELAPEGVSYRMRTRFAKFFNLPELMSVFKGVADVQTADMIKLDVPEAVQETVVIKPTMQQLEMIREIGKRADRIRDGAIDPSEDNMLKITTDGRKLALDERIITGQKEHPLGQTKIDACVDNCMRIYNETMDKHSAQLIFCDISTPKKDGSFTVYESLRDNLIEQGVPKEEITFIHDYNTESAKEELFSKVRQGKVRFLLGSTSKMGAGMNVQNKLIAAHHLDVPWRPADLEQQDGRIIRQGNENDKVFIYRYVTENTFDAYSWQTLETKQKFISQIMTSRNPARSCEDVDNAELSYAVTKAICVGDPKIKEKMELENDVNQLRMMKTNFDMERYRMQDRLYKQLPAEYKENGDKFQQYTEDAAKLSSMNFDDYSIDISGIHFGDKESVGSAIFEMTAKYKDSEIWKNIGNYRGFKLDTNFYDGRYRLRLVGAATYHFERGATPSEIPEKMDKILSGIEELRNTAKDNMERIDAQMKTLEKELEKPFLHEEELNEKEERLKVLTEELETEEIERKEEKEHFAYLCEDLYIYMEVAGNNASCLVYDRGYTLIDQGDTELDGRVPASLAEDIFIENGVDLEEMEVVNAEWLKGEICRARGVEMENLMTKDFEVEI